VLKNSFGASEGSWLGKELEKALGNYYEVQGYSPFATCGNDQCRSKDLCVLTSAAVPSTSPSSPLYAPFIPSAPGPQVPGLDPPCSPMQKVHHTHQCKRCEVASRRAEVMQARHGLVCLKRLLSRTDESWSPSVNNAGRLPISGIIRVR